MSQRPNQPSDGPADEPARSSGAEPAAQPTGSAEAEACERAEPVETPEQAAERWRALAAERTDDLQRLQAEYVNYKRRVDRDRALSREAGAASVLADLLPVFDALELARGHDELSGGFKLVADEFAKVAGRHGLEGYAAPGEAFDPTLHEALMAAPAASPVSVPTIVQVMQPGYKLRGRVLRPARVSVAQPDAAASAERVEPDAGPPERTGE